MTATQRNDVKRIVQLMRDEVAKQMKRPVSLQDAADALEKGLRDGSLTLEKAKAIIDKHEGTYLPVPAYPEEEATNFASKIRWVIDNPEPL